MFANTEIGIDLGTSNTLIYNKNKGVIVNESSVIVLDQRTKRVIAAGKEAKEMIGKTPDKVIAAKPLQNGVIADYDLTIDMLKTIMQKASKGLNITLRKPTIAVAIPAGSTSVERRAIQDAMRNAGAKKVHLIEEPVAAAIGAGLPVDEPIANVIVDIGAGSTEAAIISYGGIVSCHSVKVGGDQLDADIIQLVKKKYNMLIGEQTAEKIKLEIGHALIEHEEQTIDVRGRDLFSGLPKPLTLSSFEIRDAMKESLLLILDTIKAALEDCPAELSGDIVDRGIILTGGVSLLHGSLEWLAKEIDVPVTLAPNPLESVAIGTGQALKYMNKLPSGIK